MKCALCGADASDLLYWGRNHDYISLERFRVVKCKCCGLVYLDPQPKAEYLSEFYKAGVYSGRSNALSSLVEPISRLFHRLRLRKVEAFRKQGKLLDVGTGKGKFLATARERGWEVYGTEPAEGRLHIARHEYGVDTVHKDLEEEPFAGSYFDVITLWHVFEHLPDPNGMLRELHSMLKDDGLLLIAVPNIDSIQSRFGKEKWFHLDVPRHLYHYSPRTLQMMLEKNGFRALQIDHFSLENNPLGVIQTFLNVIGCEPNFLFNFLKRNVNFSASHNTARLTYSALALLITLPLMATPLTLLSFVNSALGQGGTFQAYACKRPPVAPSLSDASERTSE